MKSEILESYHILGSEKIDKQRVSQNALHILKNSQEPIFVSVRSSATTEDLADASFAGQHESFLNVKGDTQLLEHVKKCFSSLYTPRAIYYRNKKGFKEEDSLLAVVVQKMIDSEKSGVVFSRNPVGDENEVAVEAVFGLGEGIVSGQIKPDNYIVSRDLKIKDKRISDKKIAIVRSSSGENTAVRLSYEKSRQQVLTNGEILEIAQDGFQDIAPADLILLVEMDRRIDRFTVNFRQEHAGLEHGAFAFVRRHGVGPSDLPFHVYRLGRRGQINFQMQVVARG